MNDKELQKIEAKEEEDVEVAEDKKDEGPRKKQA